MAHETIECDLQNKSEDFIKTYQRANPGGRAKVPVLEIDGERKRYGLGGRIGGNYTPPEQATVRIWPTPNRMYLVVGSINGYPVDFVVDTGATLVSLSGREARRLGIDYRVVGTPGRSTTASGIAEIFLVNLDRVRVGVVPRSNSKPSRLAPCTMSRSSFARACAPPGL